MREVEFRGKRIDDNEWLHGFYDGCYEGATINYLKDGIAWNCKVHPETVGQYIGIKDIHQRKVFQGDIVKVKRENFIKCYETKTTKAQEFTGEIVWYENSWYIFSKQKNGIGYHSFWMWNVKKDETDDDLDTLEIIGNRWDNPEMAVIE